MLRSERSNVLSSGKPLPGRAWPAPRRLPGCDRSGDARAARACPLAMPRMVAFSGYSASICSAIPASSLARSAPVPLVACSVLVATLHPPRRPIAAAPAMNSRRASIPHHGHPLLKLIRWSASKARLAVRGNPFLDHRGDLLAPFAAVEDAVMADILGEVILLLAPPAAWSRGRARRWVWPMPEISSRSPSIASSAVS